MASKGFRVAVFQTGAWKTIKALTGRKNELESTSFTQVDYEGEDSEASGEFAECVQWGGSGVSTQDNMWRRQQHSEECPLWGGSHFSGVSKQDNMWGRR
mmetsp:Transcript_49270/g.86742  ORF Transcript_49270/g.86742 Transcript_49270/m.86742 type:complete len:99 (+) Transcript_49270:52-348(+)